MAANKYMLLFQISQKGKQYAIKSSDKKMSFLLLAAGLQHY